MQGMTATDDGFLSTPSARRATSSSTIGTSSSMISIHALREEGDLKKRQRKRREQSISIHALREEGDLTTTPGLYRSLNFYPRPPRGGRHIIAAPTYEDTGFLSTPSARRATNPYHCSDMPLSISIHALREEGDVLPQQSVRHEEISIHALREEGDGDLCTGQRKGRHFYPRPPRGGRLKP